eukprot:7389606-Prymnesium_polylepis.1
MRYTITARRMLRLVPCWPPTCLVPVAASTFKLDALNDGRMSDHLRRLVERSADARASPAEALGGIVSGISPREPWLCRRKRSRDHTPKTMVQPSPQATKNILQIASM